MRPLLGAVTQSAGMLPPISYGRDRWGRTYSILDEFGPTDDAFIPRRAAFRPTQSKACNRNPFVSLTAQAVS